VSKQERNRRASSGGSLPGRGNDRSMLARSGPALALVLGVANAHAAEPVRLHYEAPADCPNESVFIERVRERTSHLELAGPSDLARSLSVTLRVEAGGAVGRVDFVDTDGVPVSRVVRGESCDEVSSGLALVTALALEATPTDSVGEPPPLDVTPQAAPVAQQRPAPSETSNQVAPTAKRSTASATAGFGAGFVGWAGPNGGLSLDAFFGWSFRAGGPSLRVGAWHWRASDDSAGRESTFRGWGGRVEGCPLALVHGALFAEPCLGTNLGMFRAEGVPGVGVSHPEKPSLFWYDLLVVGRVGVRLGRLVVVEGQGELEVPLFSHRFGYNDENGLPASTVFEVPTVSGGAELHVGVRFP